MSAPAQNNPAITPWYYQPSKFAIADITRGQTTTITIIPATTGGTTVNPNYVVGQKVRIQMSFGYGMRQIDNQEAIVLSVPSVNTVEINIDSSAYNAFITSPVYSTTPSQIIAIGDINSGETNGSGPSSTVTYIPGSFRDISS